VRRVIGSDKKPVEIGTLSDEQLLWIQKTSKNATEDQRAAAKMLLSDKGKEFHANLALIKDEIPM